MKTNRNLTISFNAIVVMIIILFSQSINAQSYLNVNYSGGTNKFSLISDLKSITFDGSGGIVFTKNDNSSSTETISTITNLTFDASAGTGSPLPVELVSITASLSESSVILNWSTATEVNNYGFEILRSSAPQNISHSEESNWVKIGFVKGNGNSNSTKNYSFDDASSALASGSVSYRLKQIDFNGAFEYSDVVSIQLGVPANYEIKQNYPNPFNPTTTISFQLPAKSFTTLKVYDILGKEVAELINEEKAAGKYSISFNGSQLASGVYFSRLTAGSFTSLIKMLMIK